MLSKAKDLNASIHAIQILHFIQLITIQITMKTLIKIILFVFLPFLLGSCRTPAPAYDYQELAQASIRLGIDIDMKDNHDLYVESSKWLGVPYRNGGMSKKGVDCSGFTSSIYKTVYRKNLERNSEDQRKKDCKKIKKGKLKEGDLVFFHSGRKKKKASHVGIYLKDGKFIHASTRRGVVVSHLEEEYWEKHWLSGGRP